MSEKNNLLKMIEMLRNYINEQKEEIRLLREKIKNLKDLMEEE